MFRGAKVHARMKTESTPRAPSYPVPTSSAPIQTMMPMVPPYLYAPYPSIATGGFYGYGNGRIVPQQLPGGMQAQMAPPPPPQNVMEAPQGAVGDVSHPYHQQQQRAQGYAPSMYSPRQGSYPGNPNMYAGGVNMNNGNRPMQDHRKYAGGPVGMGGSPYVVGQGHGANPQQRNLPSQPLQPPQQSSLGREQRRVSVIPRLTFEILVVTLSLSRSIVWTWTTNQ